MKLEGKEHHEKKHGTSYKELALGCIVLLYNIKKEKDLSHKPVFKWLGLD